MQLDAPGLLFFVCQVNIEAVIWLVMNFFQILHVRLIH